ncbi:unnamed protein product [Alternaria burnsii]|nr:unnamed protein product [Alternaria burnsii]
MGDSPSVNDLHEAIPLTVSYDSHYSKFTFDAGPVRVEARFFSPILPQDLCKSSVPLSYLEVAYITTDGTSHDVQLYSGVDNSWLAGGNSTMRWSMDYPGESFDDHKCPTKATGTPETLYHWEAEILDQVSWFERGLRNEPYWGKLHYISSPRHATEFSFANGLATTTRKQFVRDGVLDRAFDQDQPRRPDDRVPVFAYSYAFMTSQSGSVLYTIGTNQEPAVHYRTAIEDVELQPW